MQINFSNVFTLTQDQFIDRYSKSRLHSNGFLAMYWHWMHGNAQWHWVIEEYVKTDACKNFYPSLYAKHNSNAPPA